MNYEDLTGRIKGPVFPVVIPFAENQEVDHDALRSYVRFLIDKGAKIIQLTVGTSRYNLLTTQEMFDVNESVVVAVEGKAVTIVAGPGPGHGSTRENVEFARHAKSIGADAIMVLYPERWYGDEPVVEFFHEVADSCDIGVMIHAMPMRDGFGGIKALKYLNAELLEKILTRPNLIGIKEENGDRSVFEEILERFKSRIPIIGAGGSMRRFLGDHKLGSSVYLVGIGSFDPQLTMKFYNAVMANDLKTAEAIAEEYEDVYFPMAVKFGWHRSLKETLVQMNIMNSHERAPFNRVSREDRAQMRNVLIKCGWIEGDD